MINRLLLFCGVCIAAAILYPIFGNGPQLDRAAAALALAGPAAGAAISAAVGRPTLAAAALAGVGAYASGLFAQAGMAIPLAVLCSGTVAMALGAAIALVCHRLSGPAFLVASLLIALAAGALVQALPALTGAESGLGPIPPIQVPLGAARNAVATPVGDFHVLLGAAAITAVVAALGLRLGPGPGWRAVGSDRARAASSGISALAAEVAALALAGLMAGVCGALSAHVSRLASPSFFTIDAAALPLLAALAAGRQPLEAALIAIATGVVGQLVLPAAGWHGPPDANSLALGLLGIAAVATLLPSRVGAPAAEVVPAVPAEPAWPLDALHLRGARLRAEPITVRSREGALLVAAPAFEVGAGQVRAVVGPNGSGKSTLLRAIANRVGRRGSGVTLDGDGERSRCLLMPQEGGGWGFCTVRETLHLAASRGRSQPAALSLTGAWLDRLGLRDVADAYCSELPGARRRFVELGRVLLSSPSIVLADEPLAGLDDNLRAAAVSCLRAASEGGLTVLIAEHDRDAVATLAGSVLTLDRAELQSGSEPVAAPAT